MGDVGPPPHPGRHEGKPSTTWTPPVQNEVSTNPSSKNPPAQVEGLTIPTILALPLPLLADIVLVISVVVGPTATGGLHLLVG